MTAAYHEQIKYLPIEFYHDPLIKNNYGWTVAMLSANYGNIDNLPKEFYHSSLVTDEENQNIIDLLVRY